MEAHLRQQFDVLLATSCEAFTERIVQRCAGGESALAALRSNPQGEGVWLDDFVEAVFRENLLDSPDGALFVLGALARRPVPSGWPAGSPSAATQATTQATTQAAAQTVASTVTALARHVFAELLQQKVVEQLSRSLSFG
ncbi:hypothetical protein JT358_08210 [Micrococcales bacterium 31B]|nr:hypothetical protein [Micrococcales bacterium 31B]